LQSALALGAIALAAIGAACVRLERRAEPRVERGTSVPASPRVVAPGQPVPKGGGIYKVGSPYAIDGRWYRPQEDPAYDHVGVASYYGAAFHGRRTANGEVFDMWALTAAHQTLPLPSYVYVTNLDNGRTLLLRVNDRGPFVNDRIIDLSQAAARLLGTEQQGLARVRVRYAGPAPLSGDDSQERRFLASQGWARVAQLPASASR
jgi:rare lipoprotein A